MTSTARLVNTVVEYSPFDAASTCEHPSPQNGDGSNRKSYAEPDTCVKYCSPPL